MLPRRDSQSCTLAPAKLKRFGWGGIWKRRPSLCTTLSLLTMRSWTKQQMRLRSLGANSVMCAYNSLRGEPACASSLVYQTLREKWHFDGYTVSDCGAVSDIYQGHDYVLTVEQAAAIAVKAGTDLTCGTEYQALALALQDRLLFSEDIDRAVKRLFTARSQLGMFDPTERIPWSNLTLAGNDTTAHRDWP